MAPGSKYDGTSEVFNDASSAGVSSPSVTAPYSQDGMVGRSSDKIFVADERSNNLPIPVAHEDLAHGNDIELHQHKDTGAVAVAGTDTGITQQTGTYTACYPEAYGHVAPSSVTSTAYEAYSTKILHGVNNGVEGGVVERGVQGDEKRKGAGCCGLSRKASWLIGIGVLVLLIAAIAGGVAGGLASQRSQQDGAAEGADEGEGQDSPSTPQRNASWVDTQIAAVNFTDSANATRRALFYQREQGSIWMSLSPTVKGGSDDDGEAWTQFDVGSALTAARNKDGYSPPKNGTPLAAAAIPPGEADFLGYKFAVGLYYLDEDDMVREVLTYDSERLEAWVVGGLQRQPAQASAGSQLAATPHFCADGCANAICVAHQESSGELSVACGNAWDQPWELDAAYPGTSLAMVPFASDNGKNITKANWMRLFWQRDNAIQVYADNDGSWGIGESPLCKPSSWSYRDFFPSRNKYCMTGMYVY